MSYARMSGDSDVYVYEHSSGFIECCGCRLTAAEEYEDFGFARLSTAREALAHLEWHVREGDRVPQRAFDRIRKEHEDLDAAIPAYVPPPEVRERQRKKMQEIFGSNPEVFKVSAEEYARLEEALDEPPNPEVVEKLRKLLKETGISNES